MELLSTNILFSKTCRTCLYKTSEGDERLLQSIFDCPNDQPMRIVELLANASPQLVIEATDELPKEICAECLERVLSVHTFQEMCLHSDTHMRSLLLLGDAETKIEHTTDITATLEAPMEDPIGFSGELRNCLKLELLEDGESENNNCDDYNEITDEECKSNEDTDVKKKGIQNISVNFDSDGMDNHTDKSAINENHDFEGQNIKNSPNTRSTRQTGGIFKKDDYGTMQADIETPNKKKRKMCLPCSECGKVFDRSYSLARHMSVHKVTGKPYECSKCKYRFVTKQHLKRHELSHDIEPATDASSSNPEGYKCLDCPRRFAKRESLSAHIKSHRKAENDDPMKEYICDFCPKKFTKLNMLTRHARSHEENKKFKCHICDKCFGLNAHLTEHLNKHNGVKPYVCEYCNKAFQQSCTLKDHIRTHTGEQPFLCSECGKAFNSSSNMKQHLLRHTGEKRYECPECPKKFPCLSDLASHMAVHKKVKPHICDICGAAFGKPYQLKKHKMYHNGEKPHKCEYCEMRFVCADHMRRHMRTHTGEKPYKCKYCERAFAQSNDLVKHLRSHVGENVYKCELCPKAFRLATELREHFALHKYDDAKTSDNNACPMAEELAPSNIRVAESVISNLVVT